MPYAYEQSNGTLAPTRLDLYLHLRCRIRVVSALVPAGVCVGEGLDFLAGSGEQGTWSKMNPTSGTRWFLPNENEWYKAAYYDAVDGVYYEYPTGTNSRPNNNLPSHDTGNLANFSDPEPTTGNRDYLLTRVGAYMRSASPFVTFDQGGNIAEWNEAMFQTSRGLRGGHASSGVSE
jgi:hypothetical protein